MVSDTVDGDNHWIFAAGRLPEFEKPIWCCTKRWRDGGEIKTTWCYHSVLPWVKAQWGKKAKSFSHGSLHYTRNQLSLAEKSFELYSMKGFGMITKPLGLLFMEGILKNRAVLTSFLLKMTCWWIVLYEQGMFHSCCVSVLCIILCLYNLSALFFLFC